MAPTNPLAAATSLKRSSPSAGEKSGQVTKRQRREYHHHHRLQKPLETGDLEPVIVDETLVDRLLNLSIGLILRETGFSMADPVALDSFRNGVEEYMLHFLSDIRQSMASCRRTQPIPHDFEHALRRNDILLESLRPHLKPLHSVDSPPRLLSEPPDEPAPRTDLPFLGPDLNGTTHRSESAYIPKHFPNFPSRHTYQQTPVFTKRETDPRKIREQATEEGRLGEEALRKLARADKDDQSSSTEHRDKSLWGRKNESMDSMFEKTLKALLKKSSIVSKKDTDAGGATSSLPRVAGKLDLGPIVNCEKAYWRKSATAEVRKKPIDAKETAMVKVGK